MDAAQLEAFGLDPDVLHLNHGAFGVAPVAVRQAAAAWRERAERNPHRFNRVWLAAPDGLAYWEALGGWDAVARLADLVTDGQKRVAEALGVSLEGLPVTPAPAMPLPDGVLTSAEQVDPFYEDLSRRGVEVAPVSFAGTGYLRIAAAPYNTPDDYDRLAATVLELPGRS